MSASNEQPPVKMSWCSTLPPLRLNTILLLIAVLPFSPITTTTAQDQHPLRPPTFEEMVLVYKTTHKDPDPKVLNLLNAGLLSKSLSRLPSPPRWHESLPEIQERIKSLEDSTVTLPDYIESERSRLQAQLAEQPVTKLSEALLDQLSTLRSTTESTLLPTTPRSTQLTVKSQLVTLSLLEAYVCAKSSPTPESLNPFNNASHVVHLPRSCVAAFSSLHSELTKYPAHYIRTELPDKNAQILHRPFHNFQSASLNATTTTHDISTFITLASDLDTAVDQFITALHLSGPQLHTTQNSRNWRLFSTFHQIPHFTYADAGPVENALTYQKTLRSLRHEIYSAITSPPNIHTDGRLLGQTLQQIQGVAPTPTTTTTCRAASALHHKIHPIEFESYLAKVNYYQLWQQLSFFVNDFESRESTIPDLRIRTSLLQIEYKRALTEATSPVPSQSVSKQHNPTNRLRSYTLVLTESIACSPDNFVQPCYLVNGQYPGPPIIVNKHDFLRVTVINRMSVSTTMHFHGILMKHTVSSDGVSFVTQYPILPNQSYVYEMYVGEQTGTFMYHGHMRLDLIWLHGALIVLDNPEEWQSLGPRYAYDNEHTFLLEEIFHESFDHIIDGIIKEGIDDPPVTSFGINGKSYGRWNTTEGGSSGYEVLTVIPGKVYRFRVINMAGGSMLVFTVEGHNMTVIEMDGILVDPVVTDRLELHTGQRYSVLVRMDKDRSNYWVQSRLMGDEGGADNGRAILHYECAEDPKDMRTRVYSEPSGIFPITADTWILDELVPISEQKQEGVYDFPEKSDRQILLDMQMRTTEGPPRYLINGKLVDHKRNYTLLEKVRAGGDIQNDTHVFPIREGEVVDFVFQNRVDDTGGCDEHPIHFHGHYFWLAASGADLVNTSALDSSVIPPGNRRQFRDTITLFPNSTVESEVSGTPCGWAVVRLVADNPGLWLVHCHVTSHMMLGKRFYLYEFNENNPKLTNE